MVIQGLSSNVTSSEKPSLPAQSTGTGSPAHLSLAVTHFILFVALRAWPPALHPAVAPPPSGKVLTGATRPCMTWAPHLSCLFSYHCPLPQPTPPSSYIPDSPEPCLFSTARVPSNRLCVLTVRLIQGRACHPGQCRAHSRGLSNSE